MRMGRVGYIRELGNADQRMAQQGVRETMIGMLYSRMLAMKQEYCRNGEHSDGEACMRYHGEWSRR